MHTTNKTQTTSKSKERDAAIQISSTRATSRITNKAEEHIRMTEIETMESMAQRLRGCGSGDQAQAVIEAIAIIRGSCGQLDACNRATALYHLSVALSGCRFAVTTLMDAASRFEVEDDGEDEWVTPE